MKRNEGESFEDYQARRKEDNIRTKQLLKGTWFWKSKNTYNRTQGNNRGTYRRAIVDV